MSSQIDAMFATQALGVDELVARAEALAEGTVLAGRYLLERALGAGGMGAVYQALDRDLDERVALKVLHPEIAREASAIERFVREVKLARRVTHPNVARTYDLGADASGCRFLTMELIEGTSLGARVEHGPHSLSDALRLAAESARGLVAAHAVGVVHRDLKPDNVLLAGGLATGPLTGSERVVLTDFGIARLTEAGEREGADERSKSQRGRPLTMGNVVGTPAYMAPEQVVGETPDGRSDVFALGVLLFELLTGQLPFEGSTSMELATARLTRAARDVRELDPSIPASVAELLAAMLARKREERPDATMVLDQLDALRGAARSTASSPVEGLARMPGTMTMAFEPSLGGGLKGNSVAVLPFTSAEETLEGFARELGSTLADGLSRVRVLRVVPPAVAGAGADLAALGRAHRVDVVLTGSLRREGDRVRANLRLLDPSKGTQQWGERFEGSATALFALEDLLARAAENALRALGEGDVRRDRGPADPTARALFERALECSRKMNEEGPLREGIELARRALERAPGDASVMSVLGFVLVRLALLVRDEGKMMAEAEDWALRALDADASLAQTYTTLGLLRLHQGDLKASVRAFREALSRDPREPEAAAYLGRFLVETGFIDEGAKRLEYAIKIEPGTQHAWWNLARAHALNKNWARVEQLRAEAAAATGNVPGTLLVHSRLAFWRNDGSVALEAAARIEEAGLPEGHFVATFMPLLRAFAAGALSDEQLEPMYARGMNAPSPAMRAFWLQVFAEMQALRGRDTLVLDAIEAAAPLAFVDLGWFDHCPLLESVRGAGRFGRARAIVAARAAGLWK